MWAARTNPVFTANSSIGMEADGSGLHYLTFINKGASQKAFARTSDMKFRYDGNTPNDNYLWRLVGTASDFILQSKTGYFVYTNSTGGGPGGEYLLTTNESLATHFSLENGTDANNWAFLRKTGDSKSYMNPRNGDVQEWNNDNGCRISISVVFPLRAIIHRQHATFNYLGEVSTEQKPNNKFIQEGKGLIDHPYAANFTGAGYTENDRKIQNTSVFHVTQYAKKGETTSIALPHTRKGGLGKINKYQRWYNYETERPLDEGIVSGLSGYTMYSNGHARTGNPQGSVTITLPSNRDEILVGVDDSEFNDYSIDSDGNFVEPSLSMRTIIHVVSAEKMASALVAKGSGDKWFEEKTYIVPNIKRGSSTHRNNSDILPLDMPFSNYWIYTNDTHSDIMRIVNENGNYNTLSNNISFEIEGDAKDYITVDLFKNASGPGLYDPLDVRYNHFIYYKVKGDGLTRVVPAGSKAVIKMYASNGANGTKYQLAKFTLNFQADCEPLAITSVVGDENSTRSRDYFESQQMAEVASLTFSEKRVDFKGFGGVGNDNNHYAFPLDPTRTSYAFSPDDAFGGYRITKSAYGMKVLPVSLYERNIKEGSTSLTPVDDDYYLYIDAAESPGQVASIPLDGSLCSGTRLFFYGWLNSQNPFESGNATPASVILELVGRKNGKDMILASYLPGIVSDAAYTPEGEVIRSVKDGSTASTEAAYSFSYNLNGHGDDQTRLAAWQSIGFSYLLTESGFDGFELRIINNCFSTAGGDYSLDDFRVFVNPPKGSVDFTTPLCNDKTRHAKIHAEYDMLKNISGINDDPSNTDQDLYVTCCFLEADIFDSNTKINGESIFDVDAQGNHNLKAAYSSGQNLVEAEALINAAFGKALVGTRQLSAADKANHGFHVYKISHNYESIAEYAYNDSKVDEVYREEVGGIRRIVFKKDVVRGDQTLLADGRWPHMRPSTTYYLVFSPMKTTQEDINHHSTATDIFHIHESCSFFGKFTTKDPLHVILDNAEIAADLPTQAVCHGETLELSFDMPALKEQKKIDGVIPIFDEANCTSIESMNNQFVSGTEGPKYKYETVLTTELVQTRIKNLPYDWWMGGKYDDSHTFGKTQADYLAATHPTIKYSHPHDIAHKKDGDPVNIAQAMKDFRFYYPDFGKDKTNVNGESTLTNDDWNQVYVKDYNSDSGYGLLQSEIDAIKDLVTKGILKLHLTALNVSLSVTGADTEGEKKVINFTLVPIQPSFDAYDNHNYIYCPEPRGVKITLRDAAPKMLNGFGDKTYPADMENVPVRAGLQQLNAVSHDLTTAISADAKKLRVPLRGLSKALEEGKYLMPYEKTTGNVTINTVFLVDTNDPVYENKFDNQEQLTAWGKILKMQAQFGTTDNYMDLIFNKKYEMREGYTYRIGVRFVEVTDEAKTTRDIACDGIFYFDLKVVPEFQVWTGKESVKNPTNITEWTNDRNWARADRTDLLADGTKTGNVITAATDYAVVDNYPNNDDNFGNHTWGADSLGFMPMYFTNVLFNEVDVEAPILSAASIDSSTGFLSTAGTQSNRSGFEHHVMIDHEITDKQIAFIKNDAAAKDQKVFSIVYDMSVAPTGSDNNVMALTNRYAAPFNGSSYMCEPFGTNVTKGITFAPQTQLINAQHLTYYKAWVEYELDVNRWYTLGSPLQNTFAGEWYAPTDGGQQNSPYFYDITYQQGADSQQLNDRFRPAIYQRSWDSKGNVPVYLKAGGTASWGTGQNANNEPAYVKADWSYVFNNVKKQYSNGGFSVKVNTDLMTNKPSDDKAIIRMPKADMKYTYYDSDGSIGQHNDVAIDVNEYRGRLWSDKLAGATTFTQIISNSTDGNNFFLVNNPFMANMDMSVFFEKNTQLETKYWIMTGDKQLVAVQNYDGTWVSTTGDNAKVGPLQGFFVKGTGKETTVTFTAAMQANTGASTAIQTRASMTESLNQLAIHASRNGYTSTAVVTLSAQASNDFKAEEDAQTFVDGNVLSEPTLYTVASDQAMTINTLSNIEVLPLGIVSDDDSEVILTFNLDSYEGHDLQLFDAVTRQLIDLSSDTELAVSGNNSNRYYIARAGALNQFGDRMQNLDGEIYNLQGLQLGTAGKGTIVIINGEKHIVK